LLLWAGRQAPPPVIGDDDMLRRLLPLIIVLLSSPAVAEDYIATIKIASGEARIVASDHSVRPATVGQTLQQNETLETGKDGALGVTFIDNTTLSLGESSRITLTKVVFNPDKGDFAFATHLVKGTFMFVSGGVAKLKPDAVNITTPVATLGIRGTRFLVEVSE
jgi:hypothetical protein